MDPGLVPAGCAACHKGHGVSRSPMLPQPQAEVCLACHGSGSSRDQQAMRGNVGVGARPALLSSVFAKPYAHPLTRGAFSQQEPGAIVCTSCHSPHRGLREQPTGPLPSGQRRLSPKDPARFEFELCESCHGSGGRVTQSLLDVSRLLNPGNRSYHPVEAPALESSASVLPSLTGQQVNCTDCHGNDDTRGPRGPHGSSVPFLLRAPYSTLDGSAESPASYGLCYTCHSREGVLSTPGFPEHRKHIVELRASCATCHNAHGSVANRALIRFGEETFVAGVSASAQAGRLAFVSDGPGSGACFVTCHGRDHAPETYGLMGFAPAASTWRGR